MNLTNLKSFLKFGYFIDYENPTFGFDFSDVDRNKYILHSEKELIDTGHTHFIKAIQNKFSSSSKQYILLSGGLDSRFILAALLEFTDASSLYTVTYGAPGTFDFELGNKTAKKLGTKHIALPLTGLKYNLPDLIDTAHKFDLQTTLFYHPPIKHLNEYTSDGVIWSGFMGDPGAGSKLRIPHSENINEAANYYIKKNTFSKTSKNIELFEEEIIPFLQMQEGVTSQITLDEQLDFYNRQLKYIAPHVLYKGATFITPFLDENYLSFILSLPDSLRINQSLFIKILICKYKKVFSIPVKNTFGNSLYASNFQINLSKSYLKIKSRFLPGTDPMTNYIDFKRELVSNSSLKKIVFQLIIQLKDRSIINDIIDIDVILKEYKRSVNDHETFLLLLASLEIMLIAGKKI